jgi:protease-4
MQFVRVGWKILVGLKDLLVLLFMLLFFAAIFALLNASPNPAMVRDGALLLKLDGVVSEQPAEIDTLTTLTSSAASVGEMRQRDIVRALKLAETDDRVKAVVVDMDRFMGGGQASLAAIGSSLDGVKRRASQCTRLPRPIPMTVISLRHMRRKYGWTHLVAPC